MSRNKDRVGSRAQGADSPSPAVMQEANTGGFSFVTPTEFVELPSEGKYYSEDHPLRGESSIEIRQMTARDEDLLTSRTLIRKGVVLDRLIQNLVVDKNINTDSLLVGDRNAIVIAARVSGYGSEYTTQVQCPQCGAEQVHEFDLNSAHIDAGDIERACELQTTFNDDGTFETVLPRTGVVATFKLFDGSDERYMVNVVLDNNNKEQENLITRQLRRMIVAVNGNNTPEALEYFVNNVPSVDSRHLRMVFKMVSPDIDLTQDFECAECNHTQQMEVPLTADFFWPDR